MYIGHTCNPKNETDKIKSLNREIYELLEKQ
jgi:hypothetical protein